MRAGEVTEIHRASGDWAFVDIGFSRDKKTSGLLVNDGQPIDLTFANLREELIQLSNIEGVPLNLVLEAPLSVAFTKNGNPAGRSIERKENEHRYWYAGLGCQVTMAAAYLLRAIHENGSQREVRLFEAFVSFKPKGVASSHSGDVKAIRSIAWSENRDAGSIVAGDQLAGPEARTLESAFLVFGFNYGIPPVIIANGA
jgi:hypothetical protein